MSAESPPWEPPLASTEVDHLDGALHRLQATFRWKADGLTHDQLTARIPTSSLTVGGLLKHLAHVEADWTTRRLDGSASGEPWDSVDWDAEPEWDFASADLDDPASLYALYDASVVQARQRFRAAVASGGVDQLVHLSWPDGRHVSLRRVICDVIEEYGRHTGHADLIRESIDGRVGEDPPREWSPPSGW